MRTAPERASTGQHGGFTLIEVLVALAIISIGILGTAGLMLKAMAYAKTSSLRTMAAMQAASLASAMYVNRKYWADTSISPCFSTRDGDVPGCDYLTVAPQSAECTGCTPPARAIADLAAWRDSVQAALPQAEMEVTCLEGAPGATVPADRPQSCSIRIVWDEHFIDLRQPGSAQPAASAATFGPRTYVLHVTP